MNNNYESLKQYLPEKAAKPVYEMLIRHNVRLVITRHRRSKLGDFRPGIKGEVPKITLNHNLNPYSFLLTFLHEMAHHLVWKKYKNRLQPHGEEWKKTLRQLQEPFLNTDFFPQDILDNLQHEEARIFAASSSDVKMARTLKSYDTGLKGILLETLPEKTIFVLPDGRRFQKLAKRRKNYLCISLDNNRNYIFNPLAEVYPENSL